MPSTPSILLLEFYLSGGSQRLAGPLLLEGYAMMKAASQALREAGWEVSVLVDERVLPYVGFEASNIIPVEPGGLLSSIHEGLRLDSALAVAPPMGGAHASVLKALEEAGFRLLGPPSWKVEAYSDKYRQFERLSKVGVPVPRTEEVDDLSLDELRSRVSSLGLPLILKPRLGAGCEGMVVANSWSDVEEAVARGWIDRGYLAQEFLSGVHASAAVFSDGVKAWAPCLNAQLIKWGRRPSYEGGLTPLSHPMSKEGLRVAEEAVKALGLKGYVGVDLVLSEGGAYVIEVNPRLTTSIVSLLEVLGGRVLGNLLSSSGLGSLELPEAPTLSKACAFMKARAPRSLELSLKARRLLAEVRGVYVIAPTAGRVEAEEAVAMVMASGSGPKEAYLWAERSMVEVRSLLSLLA